MAKEFVTAVAVEVEQENLPEEKRGLEFDLVRKDAEGEEIERRTLVARYPKDGQVALLMAQMGRHSSDTDRMAGIIDFFVGIFDNADHAYVVTRLMDGDDEFGMADVTSILNWLMEEWSGRPTKKSSASTR